MLAYVITIVSALALIGAVALMCYRSERDSSSGGGSS